MNPSEHAYQIDRGVRHLAIVGTCADVEELRDHNMKRMVAEQHDFKAIPFAISRGDGAADYGYAAEHWVIDTLWWLQTVPKPHSDRIRGLLLGYDAKSIGSFQP